MTSIFQLLSMLKNPRALASMGGLALIMLLYFFGPRLGLRGRTLMIVIIGLLVLMVIVQVVMFLRRRRRRDQAAADLETSMIMEADRSVAMAANEQKRAREDARRELLAAIDVLKTSNLAEGRGGKAALYVLPWYLVLGTGYAGKSALIANSGLQSPGKGPGELKGIGASVNCEWWFTNHAVFLEADRRFTASAGAKAAETDWAAYLATLGKQRPGISLNGVVLTVSAADLMQGSAADIEEQARLLRKRLDTMANELELVCPVYLMVAKMDRVQGFNDYFAGLGGVGAEQVLGATLRAADMRRPDIDLSVGAEIERLYQNLCRRRQMRLIQDEHAAHREGSYLFPLQFRSLGQSVQRFVKVLCEPTAYGRNPLLRGVYFSSAGGDGDVSDQVLHEMNRMLGLPAPAVAMTRSERPLFLHGFFRKVLVPDRDIARPTRGAARRARTVRRSMQVAALVAVAALIVNLTVSFVRSHYMIRHTVDITTAADLNAVVDNELRVPGVDERLQGLDPLRTQLEALDNAGGGVNSLLWMGMNKGDRVSRAAREVYLKRFAALVVVPYYHELEFRLRGQQPGREEFEEYYRRYQAYRMLYEPSRGDPGLVAEVLTGILRSKAGEVAGIEAATERLTRHVEFAMTHARELNSETTALLVLDEDLITKSEGIISDSWNASVYYRFLIEQVNNSHGDLRFSLDDIPSARTMLTTRDVGAGGVAPAFTRRCWDEVLSQRLGQIDAELERSAWMLPRDIVETKAQFRASMFRYFEGDYVQAWNAFLSSVTFVDPLTMTAALDVLESLEDKTSPYMMLLDAADRNLTLTGSKDGGDVDVKAMLERITNRFAALHAFQRNDPADRSDPPRGRFKERMAALQEQLRGLNSHDAAGLNAKEFSKTIFDNEHADKSEVRLFLNFAHDVCDVAGDHLGNEAFHSLLRQPGLYAWRAVLRETERYLNGQWGDKVYRPFNSNLGNGYPFLATAGARDVAPGDFGDFFGTSGTFADFVKKELAPYLNPETYEPRLVYDYGLRLSDEAVATLSTGRRLTEAFFPEGGSEPRFRFSITSEQAVVTPRGTEFFSQTNLTVGSQVLRFGSGLGKQEDVRWPQDRQGARIDVVLADGKNNQRTFPVIRENGDWGLFRLVAAADRENIGAGRFRATWTAGLEDGRSKVIVPFVISFGKSLHPFAIDMTRFKCPAQLTP